LNTISPLAIETYGLTKYFGTTRAVDGVDLAVAAGSVYGFLGPNGAGKTTTIRILATLMQPDAGTARVFGYDVVGQADEVRRRVGLTGQFASVDDDLTGQENLVLLARLQGFGWPLAKRRAADLLEAFGLSEAAGRMVKTYSGGMRRRIDIAASIVVTPELLFLDEPTTGLDPRNRNQVWDIIKALTGYGCTIFLTTQYLYEADELADRIAVIDNGRIVAEGTSGQLKAAVGSGAVHIRLINAESRTISEQLLTTKLGLAVKPESDPAEFSIILSDPDMATRALWELSQAGIGVATFSYGQPSLDEVFLMLTGHPADSIHNREPLK